MTDREKVIKGLESLHARLLDVAMQDSVIMLDVSMVANAIAMLKEQEAVVNCISCIFYRSDGECALHNSIWKPEGFCSHAIRKESR